MVKWKFLLGIEQAVTAGSDEYC